MVSARSSAGRGRSGAECCVATLADGRTVFVKRAHDDAVREANLLEAEVLLRLNGLHAPDLLDVLDEGSTLVIEHLGAARWAPQLPRPAALWEAIDAVATTTPPHRIRRMQRRYDPWEEVEPAWWMASPMWWRSTLPVLREAAASAWWNGRTLMHGDVSATNVCSIDGRVVLVDWSDSAVGSLDWARVQGGLMYRLHGIDAEVPIVDPAPAVASLAGFVAKEYQSTDDPAKGAAYVVALTWACRVLGLDPPPFGVPS